MVSATAEASPGLLLASFRQEGSMGSEYNTRTSSCDEDSRTPDVHINFILEGTGLEVKLSCVSNDPVPYERCKVGNGRRIQMLHDLETTVGCIP